jgi:hypothetical protein
MFITGRKPLAGGVETVSGQADLPQAVRTLRAASRLASRLHRRQQQRHENTNDADHNQQFDEREASAKRRAPGEEIRILHEKPRRIVPLRLIVATNRERVNIGKNRDVPRTPNQQEDAGRKMGSTRLHVSAPIFLLTL